VLIAFIGASSEARRGRRSRAAVSVASMAADRYIGIGYRNRGPPEQTSMRAEIEKLVEEIKQSIGLLRRHL
jgi:hypothetical protein